jgi:hypothetical protein
MKYNLSEFSVADIILYRLLLNFKLTNSIKSNIL